MGLLLAEALQVGATGLPEKHWDASRGSLVRSCGKAVIKTRLDLTLSEV